MQRSNNARAIVDADLLLQRSRAGGQRVLLAQRRRGLAYDEVVLQLF